MRKHLRNEICRLSAILTAVLVVSAPSNGAESFILHLKNGDRVTGRITAESTNSVTLSTPFFGNILVPLTEITKREAVPEPPATTNQVASTATSTTSTNGTTAASPSRPPKVAEAKPPLTPTNPEATPISTTPNFWKHDIRFGLNMRYATKYSQELYATAKSTYGKPPFRHIFDTSVKYGKVEGVESANSVGGSQKTEYQLSPKTYLFNLVGAGYDKVRLIDFQYEVGPGFGIEMLKLTNFVWKGETGFNFQDQFRADDTRQTSYSVRIAEIFAWRVWEKLTADAKIEFFPNLADFGEYRLRFEGTLRYPVSKGLSLNLEVIDLYDTNTPRDVSPNDLQIRSTIGVSF